MGAAVKRSLTQANSYKNVHREQFEYSVFIRSVRESVLMIRYFGIIPEVTQDAMGVLPDLQLIWNLHAFTEGEESRKFNYTLKKCFASKGGNISSYNARLMSQPALYSGKNAVTLPLLALQKLIQCVDLRQHVNETRVFTGGYFFGCDGPQRNARDSVFLAKTPDGEPFKVTNFRELDLGSSVRFLTPFVLASVLYEQKAFHGDETKLTKAAKNAFRQWREFTPGGDDDFYFEVKEPKETDAGGGCGSGRSRPGSGKIARKVLHEHLGAIAKSLKRAHLNLLRKRDGAAIEDLSDLKDSVEEIAELAEFDTKPFNYEMTLPSSAEKKRDYEDASTARTKHNKRSLGDENESYDLTPHEEEDGDNKDSDYEESNNTTSVASAEGPSERAQHGSESSSSSSDATSSSSSSESSDDDDDGDIEAGSGATGGGDDASGTKKSGNGADNEGTVGDESDGGSVADGGRGATGGGNDDSSTKKRGDGAGKETGVGDDDSSTKKRGDGADKEGANTVASNSSKTTSQKAIGVTKLKSDIKDITKRASNTNVPAEFTIAKKHRSKTIMNNVPFSFQKKLEISRDGKYFVTIEVEPNTHQVLQQAWNEHPNMSPNLPVWASEFIDLLQSHKNTWDNSLNHDVTEDGKNIVLWRTDEIHRFFKGPGK